MIPDDLSKASQGFEIVLAFTPKAARDAMQVLWSLDATLGGIVAAARDPMIAQMRLTWWHQALSAPSGTAPRGHPVLDALRPVIANHDVDPDDLAAMIDGWEELLEPLPLLAEGLDRYAVARGEAMFALSARLIGAAPVSGVGRAWALADFAVRCSDTETAARAFAMAREAFDGCDVSALPRPLRIVARLARGDAIAGKPLPRAGWRMLRAVY